MVTQEDLLRAAFRIINIADNGWDDRTVEWLDLADTWRNEYRHEVIEPSPEITDVQMDLLEEAWGIIANVSARNGEGWESQHQEWKEAARDWRDRYHVALGQFTNDQDLSDKPGKGMEEGMVFNRSPYPASHILDLLGKASDRRVREFIDSGTADFTFKMAQFEQLKRIAEAQEAQAMAAVG